MKKLSEKEKKVCARKIVRYLKEVYPEPASELKHETEFQFLVAVILSAQATDKKVNEVTEPLFRTLKTACDFAQFGEENLRKAISQLSFYRNKAKHIAETAHILCEENGNRVPQSLEELMALPGVGYKTANVVRGELFDIWEGIAVDTHVRRFALKFGLTEETDPDRIARDLESLIPKEDWKYVNNGLVLYGRYVCPARPHDCQEHPLTKRCPHGAEVWPKSGNRKREK